MISTPTPNYVSKPIDTVDLRTIEIGTFLDEASESVTSLGDEVFITGLFSRLPDEPIVRIGNIAAIPNGAIPGWSIGGGEPVDAEGYLLEVRSLGGLSGSPVFVRPTISMKVRANAGQFSGKEINMFGCGPFYFLGLMHGHWKLLPSEHDTVEFQTTQEEGSIALGLSLAVPAKKIHEIINRQEFVEHRNLVSEEVRKRFGATTTD